MKITILVLLKLYKSYYRIFQYIWRDDLKKIIWKIKIPVHFQYELTFEIINWLSRIYRYKQPKSLSLFAII